MHSTVSDYTYKPLTDEALALEVNIVRQLNEDFLTIVKLGGTLHLQDRIRSLGVNAQQEFQQFRYDGVFSFPEVDPDEFEAEALAKSVLPINNDVIHNVCSWLRNRKAVVAIARVVREVATQLRAKADKRGAR